MNENRLIVILCAFSALCWIILLLYIILDIIFKLFFSSLLFFFSIKQLASSSTKKLWENKSNNDIKNTGPLAPLQMPGSSNDHQMWPKEHQVWSKEQQMWSTQDSALVPRRTFSQAPDNGMNMSSSAGILR